jgi:TolB-like protein
MKILSKFISFLLILSLLSCISVPQTVNTSQTQIQTKQSISHHGSPYFSGDGGKGKSIAILSPRASGLTETQNYLPDLVQGEFVSNFSSFSAINVLDRISLEEQYAELLSGYYSDDAEAGLDLGHLTPTDYILGGNITKTVSGYALQIRITKTDDKMTAASYSGTCTFDELDNLTGIRKASLELLQKLGVEPSSQTKAELGGAASINHINAQTALARGITAQRQGTEVAAQSYYYQASAFDSSFLEAAKRSLVISANIASGNLGADTRNDIAWRRAWVNNLGEFEEFFNKMINNSDPPYTLFYSAGIVKGKTDYQKETVDLSIPINLHANWTWMNAIVQSANQVFSELNAGLNATQRRIDWGLADWPGRGVTNTNPFASYTTSRKDDISIVFELVNDLNRIIGKRSVRLTPSFSLSRNNNQIINNFTDNTFETVSFNSINANDITDNLTIRISSINGTLPDNAKIHIVALTETQWQEYRNYTDVLRIESGVLKGFKLSSYDSKREQYKNLVLPDQIWGETINTIGDKAFENDKLTSVTISNGVTFIGANAFSGNQLTSVKIPNSVISIREGAFSLNQNLKEITIGANVSVDNNTFVKNFAIDYNKQGRMAGKYISTSYDWSLVSSEASEEIITQAKAKGMLKFMGMEVLAGAGFIGGIFLLIFLLNPDKWGK